VWLPGAQRGCLGLNAGRVPRRGGGRPRRGLGRARPTQAEVLVCARGGGGLLQERMMLAARLWDAGVRAEILPAAAPSLTAQYEYARARGIAWLAILAADTLHAADTVRVRRRVPGRRRHCACPYTRAPQAAPASRACCGPLAHRTARHAEAAAPAPDAGEEPGPPDRRGRAGGRARALPSGRAAAPGGAAAGRARRRGRGRQRRRARGARASAALQPAVARPRAALHAQLATRPASRAGTAPPVVLWLDRCGGAQVAAVGQRGCLGGCASLCEPLFVLPVCLAVCS